MNLTNYQDKVSLKLHIEGSRLISKKKEGSSKLCYSTWAFIKSDQKGLPWKSYIIVLAEIANGQLIYCLSSLLTI